MQRGTVTAANPTVRTVTVQLDVGGTVGAVCTGLVPTVGATVVVDELAAGSWVCTGIISGSAWHPYTTTVSGWAIGNGLQDCAFTTDADEVTMRAHIIAGTTTTFGAQLAITPPVAVASEMWGLHGMAQQGGVFVPLMVRAQAGSTVIFYPFQSGAMDNNGLINGHPFATLGTGDRIHATFTFQRTA